MGTIDFPKVPQTLKVFSKVYPGTRFMFTGKCSSKNFSLALVSSTEIAILLEFEIENVNLIKAKSFSNENWSIEKLLKNPIPSNGAFFVQLVTCRNFFEVYSGGSLLLTLDFLVPPESITGIRLMGEMEMYRVEMEHL
ncbi:Protein CBG27391 [Caenorhabditis briggsae]|uniref:Galectin n=2 Tax=Caenorhabditis briggsae TaxID=6238 RepID=B6IH07_CAEBR|nr:Protein CBG27391 [Caenorhabditis briggsae]UMM38723.1 hypothetical protein L5515_016094 [Caenorhabditis briggsae]CAR99187.1 Protein CBG27391 [Caenorhabditis briggsae]